MGLGLRDRVRRASVFSLSPVGSCLLPKADLWNQQGGLVPTHSPLLSPPHLVTWLPATQPCLDLHPLLVTQNHPVLRSPGAGMLTEGLPGWGLGLGVEWGELGGGGQQDSILHDLHAYTWGHPSLLDRGEAIVRFIPKRTAPRRLEGRREHPLPQSPSQGLTTASLGHAWEPSGLTGKSCGVLLLPPLTRRVPV